MRNLRKRLVLILSLVTVLLSSFGWDSAFAQVNTTKPNVITTPDPSWKPAPEHLKFQPDNKPIVAISPPMSRNAQGGGKLLDVSQLYTFVWSGDFAVPVNPKDNGYEHRVGNQHNRNAKLDQTVYYTDASGILQGWRSTNQLERGKRTSNWFYGSPTSRYNYYWFEVGLPGKINFAQVLWTPMCVPGPTFRLEINSTNISSITVANDTDSRYFYLHDTSWPDTRYANTITVGGAETLDHWGRNGHVIVYSTDLDGNDRRRCLEIRWHDPFGP